MGGRDGGGSQGADKNQVMYRKAGANKRLYPHVIIFYHRLGHIGRREQTGKCLYNFLYNNFGFTAMCFWWWIMRCRHAAITTKGQGACF